MKQVTLNYKSNELTLTEVPPPAVQPGSVLVRTAFSAISLGTEGMKVTRASKGLLAMARERPDQVRQVLDSVKREGPQATYRKVMNRLDVPNALGYSLAGTVIAVGDNVTEFAVGDHVACAGEGIAAHAEMVCVPRNLCAKVPVGVSLDVAAFATVGAIAMQGVRQSPISVGECVVVIGLGLVGQLAVQIYRAAGCRVLGVDLDPQKCALAVEMGAEMAINRSDPHLEPHVLQFSDGRGADAVLVTAATQSSDPVQLAVSLCRDRGTVVVLGIVGMEFSFEKAVRKEIQIRMSRSYGPGRYDPQYEVHGVDYPVSYVRWTEQRNMEGFLRLIGAGSVKLGPIITHRFNFSDAEEAYTKVRDRQAGNVMGVLFTYDATTPLAPRIERTVHANAPVSGQVVLGFIGAGNFARNTLLPALKPLPDVRLRGVANATGLSARFTADRFGFEYCTASYREILDDPAVHLVLVGTRHDLHGPLVMESMQANKAVFVEKPLTINRSELANIIAVQAATNGQVMVGFNRRFAPATARILEIFGRHSEPLVINYRVNAGFLARDHWIQDAKLGGGRILGEACHFIDWMRYVVGAPIIAVNAMGMYNARIYSGDNIVAQFQFSDGSVGNLIYVSNGDSTLAKEYIEVFGQRSSAVIDDFRAMTAYVRGKEQAYKLGSQDKGHAAEMAELVKVVRQGTPMPIPFAELVNVTEATFAILDSITASQSIDLLTALSTLSEEQLERSLLDRRDDTPTITGELPC